LGSLTLGTIPVKAIKGAGFAQANKHKQRIFNTNLEIYTSQYVLQGPSIKIAQINYSSGVLPDTGWKMSS
jgi:hypothetical protein